MIIANKTIHYNQKLSNGGYLTYWKLYRQMLKMLSHKDNMYVKIKNKFTSFNDSALEKKIRWQFFWLKVHTYTWMFVWACLIKPLGQFLSKKVCMDGAYKIVNGRFDNINLVKSTVYKIFGIPFWYSNNQKLTVIDLKELTK